MVPRQPARGLPLGSGGPTACRAAVNVAGVADYVLYCEDPYHGGWMVSRIGTPEQNPMVYAQASPVSQFHYFTRAHALKDAWTRVDQFFARRLKAAAAAPR